MPGEGRILVRGDLNPTSVRTLTPEASASTNSATFAQYSFFEILPRWCEGDLNPTSVRTLTPEASASTNSATFAQCEQYLRGLWCEGDLNPTSVRTLTPEASASTNSATFAYHRYSESIVTTEAHSSGFGDTSIVNYAGCIDCCKMGGFARGKRQRYRERAAGVKRRLFFA